MADVDAWAGFTSVADAQFHEMDCSNLFEGDVFMHSRCLNDQGRERPEVTLPLDTTPNVVEAIPSSFCMIEDGDTRTESVNVSIADGTVETIEMQLPPEGSSVSHQLPPEASQRMLAMLQGGVPETEDLPSKCEREVPLPRGEDPHTRSNVAKGVRREHGREALLNTHMNKTWCQALPEDDRRPIAEKGIEYTDLYTGRGTAGSGKGLVDTQRSTSATGV